MADNFKTLQTTIEDSINNAGGPGSIPSSIHQSILLDFLSKAGKYTGIPFKARREPNNGLVPTGTFFWNSNALNNDNQFVVTFSARSSDLNPIAKHLEAISPGSLIHFKDYSGRSGLYSYVKHEETVDPNNADIINMTIIGLVGNTNYTYQATDDEIAVFELFSNPKYLGYDDMIVQQSEANKTAGTIGLSAGDFVRGPLENGKFLNFGIYLTGEPNPKTEEAYDEDSRDVFNPNE